MKSLYRMLFVAVLIAGQGCGSKLIPGDPPPSTVTIQHIQPLGTTDESGDGFFTAGELLTLTGDASSDFTVIEKATINGMDMGINFQESASLGIHLPVDLPLGVLTVEVTHGDLKATITFELKRIVLITTVNQVEVHLLDADGNLTFTNVTLESGANPNDVVISVDGRWAFASSSTSETLIGHFLPTLNLNVTEATFVAAEGHMRANLGPVVHTSLAMARDLSFIAITLNYFDLVCSCVVKEIALVRPNFTDALIDTLVVYDPNTTTEGFQFLDLPGTGFGLNEMAISQTNDFMFVADNEAEQLHRVPTSHFFNGAPFAGPVTSYDINASTLDMLLVQDDQTAVVTGDSRNDIHIVDLPTGTVTPISLPTGELSGGTSALDPTRPYLLVPVQENGLWPFVTANPNAAAWSLLAEKITDTGHSHTGNHKLKMSPHGIYALWLADDIMHVIALDKVNDGLSGNEIISTKSFVGLNPTNIAIQP